MSPVTRNRILIVAMFVFPIVVFILFWLYGKSPEDPATTLPVMPPR
jgi:cytochrome bd-type quinol oxidase subunit 2